MSEYLYLFCALNYIWHRYSIFIFAQKHSVQIHLRNYLHGAITFGTQYRQLANKIKMPPKQKSFDYEAFAPQLKRHRCIWDIKHDNYSLADYRSAAFESIESNMGIKCEFRFSIVQCLHMDSRSRSKSNFTNWS